MFERLFHDLDTASQLERLLTAEFGLRDAAAIPHKLGLGDGWDALRRALRDEDPRMPLGPVLQALWRALQGVGAGDRYLALMAGVRFPLVAAGVHWERRLGASTPDADAFHLALGKLRWDAVGLHVQRHVEIGGQPVEWAIAGLLPTGACIKLAIRVRPAPTPMDALAEDLDDDALAAAGFEILGLREWQLRFAGTCALEVAAVCANDVAALRLPRKLMDPDDDHPVHRLQAAPVRLTPRQASPHWALRQRLRVEAPEASSDALLDRYRAQVVAASQASAEGEEWSGWA